MLSGNKIVYSYYNDSGVYHEEEREESSVVDVGGPETVETTPTFETNPIDVTTSEQPATENTDQEGIKRIITLLLCSRVIKFSILLIRVATPPRFS